MSLARCHRILLKLIELRVALIEDEDSSDDQVNEIPATKPKKSEIDDNEEPDEDDDEDVDVDVDNEYEVEDVVGHKIVKGKLKFRIKWKGFEDPTDITTEPEDNLFVLPSTYLLISNP